MARKKKPSISPGLQWTILAVLVVLLVGAWVWATQFRSPDHLVAVTVPDLSADARRGKQTFEANCASCHGPYAGGTKQGPPLIHKIYEPSHHADAVRSAAASIRDHAGERMTKLFPENSLDKPTETLPTVWQHWDEFEGLASRLAAYSGALVEAADNPRGPGASAGLMGQGQGMMGQGQGMMGQGQGMMGAGGPDADSLAAMPPDAAFMRTAQTCSACHTKFRAKKN